MTRSRVNISTAPEQEARIPWIVKYDAASGLFEWLERPRDHFAHEHSWKIWNNLYAGRPAFTCVNRKGYLIGTLYGKARLAHRLAWRLIYGEWPSGQIDHIDGDRRNNKLANLRVVSQVENSRNMKTPKTNTSGRVGVRKNPSGWYVMIGVENRQVYVGSYRTFEEAVAAREAAETEYGFHPNHGRTPVASFAGTDARVNDVNDCAHMININRGCSK